MTPPLPLALCCLISLSLFARAPAGVGEGAGTGGAGGVYDPDMSLPSAPRIVVVVPSALTSTWDPSGSTSDVCTNGIDAEPGITPPCPLRS